MALTDDIPKKSSPLRALAEHGQSVWLDLLSRPLLDSGELQAMIRDDGVVGVTSNPTIFDKAIAAGSAYDEQLRGLMAREHDDKELFLALSGEDVRRGCALLRPAWDRTGGVDGRVSWELDPSLSLDRVASFTETERLHALVDEPNLYVKIPATEPGVGAIEDAIAAGFDVNVTLIFSLQRHEQVMEAYLRGLERLLDDGGDPGSVHSVASFFVSRVDTEADRRLEAVGRPDLKGKLAVANAKLAYQSFLRTFSGRRWQRLAERGAHVQRCLWASTSTKDPAYRDTMYVEELIGADTVNTMPQATLEAFRDHGVVDDTLTRDIDRAEDLLQDVIDAGVDYDDVCRLLERQGVQQFIDSFESAKRTIRERCAQLEAASPAP